MPATDQLPSPLLGVLLDHVLRTEALALEGLRLQANVHSGLLGGNVEELVQTAEKRAYQRAEAMLTHLLESNAIPNPTRLPPITA